MSLSNDDEGVSVDINLLSFGSQAAAERAVGKVVHALKGTNYDCVDNQRDLHFAWAYVKTVVSHAGHKGWRTTLRIRDMDAGVTSDIAYLTDYLVQGKVVVRASTTNCGPKAGHCGQGSLLDDDSVLMFADLLATRVATLGK
jgi:hypothetical protein